MRIVLTTIIKSSHSNTLQKACHWATNCKSVICVTECHAHHWHLVYPCVFLPQAVRAAVCTVLLSVYVTRLYALLSHSAMVRMLEICPTPGKRVHESRPCTACVLIGFPWEVWTETVPHTIFSYSSIANTIYYAWFMAHYCTAVPRGRAESKLAPLAACDRDCNRSVSVLTT